MRSPWSDVADEVHQRTVEEDERAWALAEVATRALARGHDISRGQPGDGRCVEHRIRGCRWCGRKSHGVGM